MGVWGAVHKFVTFYSVSKSVTPAPPPLTIDNCDRIFSQQSTQFHAYAMYVLISEKKKHLEIQFAFLKTAGLYLNENKITASIIYKRLNSHYIYFVALFLTSSGKYYLKINWNIWTKCRKFSICLNFVIVLTLLG